MYSAINDVIIWQEGLQISTVPSFKIQRTLNVPLWIHYHIQTRPRGVRANIGSNSSSRGALMMIERQIKLFISKISHRWIIPEREEREKESTVLGWLQKRSNAIRSSFRHNSQPCRLLITMSLIMECSNIFICEPQWVFIRVSRAKIRSKKLIHNRKWAGCYSLLLKESFQHTISTYGFKFLVKVKLVWVSQRASQAWSFLLAIFLNLPSISDRMRISKQK